MDLVLFLATLQKISKTVVSIIRLVDYFAGHQPIHVKERLARSLELMLEYMNEKDQSEDEGDTWRNDWFPENQVSNNPIPRRLLEKTINEIINDSEEKKSEYVAKFWVNVCRTSNSDIDEATAFSYFETIELLSWRQLCIIRLVILYEDKKVDMISIGEAEKEKWIEQMPQDHQTSFYSISREYENLKNNKCFEVENPMLYSKIQPPLLLLRPELAQTTPYTHRLHSLMNLDEIPIENVEKTFSIWNVKRRKSEEDSR